MGAKLLCCSINAATALATISTFFFPFLTAVQLTSVDGLRTSATLPLTSVVGPESLAFDSDGRGPYTGVSDGRILRWKGRDHGWEEFAIPLQHRERGCNDSSSSALESVCGRALGLQFYKATGELYIADAYSGLLVVGPGGGVTRQLAAGAEGTPFHFTNGVDIDQQTGIVYFTDSSNKFERRDFALAVLTGDATGRLVKYDPKTKQLAVLLRNLSFPNGVSISRDNSFLVLAETTSCRVLKYWLRGPRAGTVGVLAELPGYPDNIKRNPRAEFWVALNLPKIQDSVEDSVQPQVVNCPVAMRLSGDGKVLEVLNDCEGLGQVSEVEEKNGTLWFGSVTRSYVGVYEF